MGDSCFLMHVTEYFITSETGSERGLGKDDDMK